MRRIAKSDHSAFDVLMAITVLPLLAADVVLAELVHLNAGQELRSIVSVSLGSFGFWILVGAYVYCRWRGMTRLDDVSQLLAWVMLAVPAISFMIPIAARTPYPLVDGALSRIDAAAHFQTVNIVRLFSEVPRIRHAFALAYNVLWILVVVALIAPPLAGRALHARRYIVAVLFASITTAALFALWPAAGPWTVQGFAPNKDQAEVMPALALLKSGQPLEEGVRSAVVAFPSFHVVLATLSIMALWRVPWIRWFGLILGSMVCVSTISTGWHYGIDVLGGLLVTYVSYEVACACIRTE